MSLPSYPSLQMLCCSYLITANNGVVEQIISVQMLSVGVEGSQKDQNVRRSVRAVQWTAQCDSNYHSLILLDVDRSYYR